MKVRYDGPGDYVNVGGFGIHRKNQVKNYPKPLAIELIEKSVRQRFQSAEKEHETKTKGSRKDIPKTSENEQITASKNQGAT